VIVDCRHDLVNLAAGRDAYAAGHLPNALFVDMEHELSGEKRGADGAFRGRHPLPEKDAFIELLRSWGVNDDTQVVAYDAHGGMYAARLWWMLRWVGHEAVAVLDGGLPAWQAAGLPLYGRCCPARRAAPSPLREPLVTTVDVNAVLHNVEHGGRTVVDARAPDRFRGENETIDPVGGHIPGAKNRFFKDNLQADGRFKAPEQLQSGTGRGGGRSEERHHAVRLRRHGLPQPAGAGSGGHAGRGLYPGSWSEWSADAARPVKTGAAVIKT
jgi:thiosulfate/3-mercaptopyruvate sulfurtransferase